jgi:hypothetical protein
MQTLSKLALAMALVTGGTALADEPASQPAAVVVPVPVVVEKPGEKPKAEPPAVRSKWAATLYGFAEFDAITDTTQSFNDLAGNGAIARSDTYAGSHNRETFGVRNSRIGIKLNAPDFDDIKASAVLEMDFLGNQATTATEAQFFTNPAFRIRHGYVKLETPYVDVLAGQYWQLFGWQPAFHPASVDIQGLPGQVYSRSPQLRLSHIFKGDALDVEVAVSASRPPERDSATPDGQAGVRLMLNDVKGVHTAGGAGTSIDRLGIGVSGVVRRFDVTEFSASPKNDVSATGWGISADAFVPIIPATPESRANALSLTGSFVHGEGTADLYTGLSGGVSFAALPNPMMTTPAPTYSPDIDNGLVEYTADGVLHTVHWQSFMVGAQYYLPPAGKLWLAANYAHLSSDNADQFGAAAKIFTKSDFFDANIFWDITPAVRFGLEYALFKQTYADDADATNHRVQFSMFYIF